MKRNNLVIGTLVFFCAACMLTLSSCSKSKDATLTPQSTKVQGDLRDYFTVVDRSYVVKYDENGWTPYLISIELQRTDKEFAFDKEGIDPVGYYGQGVKGNFGIGIEVYDATSNLVMTSAANAGGLSGVYSSDDLINLFTLAAGETGFVRWTANEFEDYDPKEFTFKITSYLEMNQQTDESVSSQSYYSDDYDDYDDLSDAIEEAADIYNEALKEAEQMYEDAFEEAADIQNEALKEAEEMYEDAFEEALEGLDEW